jgi:hypothetical protein
LPRTPEAAREITATGTIVMKTIRMPKAVAM